MRKITSVTLGETTIEFYNSIMGRETILVNGEQVSSKKSLWGTEHNFKVRESGQDVPYKLLTGLNSNGVAVSLYRDGIAVIESPTRGGIWRMVILVLIMMALGYLLGIGVL